LLDRGEVGTYDPWAGAVRPMITVNSGHNVEIKKEMLCVYAI